jgi:hypothetical protein
VTKLVLYGSDLYQIVEPTFGDDYIFNQIDEYSIDNHRHRYPIYSADIGTTIKIMMTLLIYIGIYFPKLKPYLLNYLFFYIDALVLCFLNCPNYQIFVYEYRIPMIHIGIN